jgi:hypothetical protein
MFCYGCCCDGARKTANNDQASERTPLRSAAASLRAARSTRSEPETKSRQSTPALSCSEMHQLLVETQLLQYENALVSAGYSNLDSFDFTLHVATQSEENPESTRSAEEEMMNELVTDVQMKVPHARKLIKALKRFFGFSRNHLAVPVV